MLNQKKIYIYISLKFVHKEHADVKQMKVRVTEIECILSSVHAHPQLSYTAKSQGTGTPRHRL